MSSLQIGSIVRDTSNSNEKLVIVGLSKYRVRLQRENGEIISRNNESDSIEYRGRKLINYKIIFGE